jgi:hypothetical protein
MRVWLAILLMILIVALAGCKVANPKPAVAATGDGIGRAQGQIKNAEWNVGKASQLSQREAKAYLNGARYNLEQANGELIEAAESNSKTNKLVGELQSAYEKCKYVGWQSRKYLQAAFVTWVIVGGAGTIFGIYGYKGVSSFLFRLIPISNPFVWIREGIKSQQKRS